LRSQKTTNKLPKPEDIHITWTYLPSLSKVSGDSPQERGFNFQRKIREFLESRLGYIPYLTTRIIGISGLEHEYDAIFVRDLATKDNLFFFECKWHQEGYTTSRYDVMIFNQKAFDVYYQIRTRKRKADLYRVLISSTPLTADAFKLCLSLGILVLQPYVPAETFPPLEAAIVQLRKALRSSISTEKRYLLNSLSEFRKRIFCGCASFYTRRMENGESLHGKYKELIARVALEVDSDWTDP